MEFKVAQALHQSERAALVPFEEVKIKRRGQRSPERVRLPLFPSYVFVQLDTARLNSEFYALKRLPVRNEKGHVADGVIRGLLSRSRDRFDPMALTDEDAEFVRSLSERGWQTAKRIVSPFQPGAKVKVAEGVFQGFPAEIDSVTRKKIKAKLQIFGSMRVVEFDPSQLEVA